MFLFFSMPIICSFFRLTELFQVKNGLTTKLRFFLLKIPEVWVGRTTPNGEKKRGWPSSRTLSVYISHLRNIVEVERRSILGRSFLGD